MNQRGLMAVLLRSCALATVCLIFATLSACGDDGAAPDNASMATDTSPADTLDVGLMDSGQPPDPEDVSSEDDSSTSGDSGMAVDDTAFVEDAGTDAVMDAPDLTDALDVMVDVEDSADADPDSDATDDVNNDGDAAGLDTTELSCVSCF